MSHENQKRLSEIADGDTFTVADMQWIKFIELGGWVVAITQKPWMRAVFDNETNDFSKSALYADLKTKLLPILEAAVGAENMRVFITDLLAEDGTYRDRYMESKISLPTLDFYRNHRPTFDKYGLVSKFWLATAASEDTAHLMTPGPEYMMLASSFDSNYVHPLCIFNSNIFVS